MTTDLIPAAASPFDALRRTDENGEFWSARDLMPHLGYTRWENFAAAIDRACVTLANTGMDPDVEASRRHEAFGRTGQIGVNYRLSRHAARLVAMNGDPRKPEIASAQEYFSRQTQFAETVQQQSAQPFAVPQTMSEALRLAATAWEEKEQAQAALAIAAPKAEVFDTIVDNTEGGVKPGDAARTLSNHPLISIGQNKLFARMRAWRWVFRSDGEHHVYQHHLERKPENRLVYQKKRHREDENGVRSIPYIQVYLTLRGIAEAQRLLLAEAQGVFELGGAA